MKRLTEITTNHTDQFRIIISTLVLLLFITIHGVVAQHKIVYMSGETEDVLILTISDDFIKYKKSNIPNGPDYLVSKSKVRYVIYENNVFEHFGNLNKVPENVTNSNIQSDSDEPKTEKVKFSGPRMGFTMLSPGTITQYMEYNGAQTNIITQFGWQFETRVFTTSSGVTGLIEFVPLIGGLESGLFLPSATLLWGIRSAKDGFEFGLGPNLSKSGTGVVFAAGTSLITDNAVFPINVAYQPSTSTKTPYGTVEPSGHRISILFGFNTKSKTY